MAMNSPEPISYSLRTNLTWGFHIGLLFAAGATALGVVPALVRAFVEAGVWWQKGLSFVTVIGIYVAGGLSAGLIIGLLRGLTRYWLGRRLVGMIAAVPVMLLVAYTVVGVREWDASTLLVWLQTAAIWGFVMSFVPEGLD